MKKKRIKISSIMVCAIYLSLIVASCFYFSDAKAQETKDVMGFDEGDDIQKLPDPFSLPSMLKKVLADMSKQAEEALRLKKEAALAVLAADEAKKAALAEAAKVPVKIPDLPALTVSGIISGELNPQVIINDEVFTVGDVIDFHDQGEAKILSIEKDRVTVAYMGVTHILTTDGEKKMSVDSAIYQESKK